MTATVREFADEIKAPPPHSDYYLWYFLLDNTSSTIQPAQTNTEQLDKRIPTVIEFSVENSNKGGK